MNILWSDDTNFTLDGVVNTQNCLIWGTVNPNVVHETSLHPDYITVWSDFSADFILCPFFFEENTPHGSQRCSITGARYCDLRQDLSFLPYRTRAFRGYCLHSRWCTTSHCQSSAGTASCPLWR
ncbi:hypothetical protein AVEN_55259-1 [Araneus ventricosus]|uniref:Uncharacterized protein n=1 Tax=Araneus ventricosus TaxID=182803 RepID=A0A4Y2SEL8_ARAVE|nr:hypothetical protein AVEN_55259-1 [Araneus ventricosus]